MTNAAKTQCKDIAGWVSINGVFYTILLFPVSITALLLLHYLARLLKGPRLSVFLWVRSSALVHNNRQGNTRTKPISGVPSDVTGFYLHFTFYTQNVHIQCVLYSLSGQFNEAAQTRLLIPWLGLHSHVLTTWRAPVCRCTLNFAYFIYGYCKSDAAINFGITSSHPVSCSLQSSSRSSSSHSRLIGAWLTPSTPSFTHSDSFSLVRRTVGIMPPFIRPHVIGLMCLRIRSIIECDVLWSLNELKASQWRFS